MPFLADIARAVDASTDAAHADLTSRQWAASLRSEALEERIEAALYRCTPSELSERIADSDLWTLVDEVLHAALQQYRALPYVSVNTPKHLQAMHKLVDALIRREVSDADIDAYRDEV